MTILRRRFLLAASSPPANAQHTDTQDGRFAHGYVTATDLFLKFVLLKVRYRASETFLRARLLRTRALCARLALPLRYNRFGVWLCSASDGYDRTEGARDVLAQIYMSQVPSVGWFCSPRSPCEIQLDLTERENAMPFDARDTRVPLWERRFSSLRF
jgi:hypothetical protein